MKTTSEVPARPSSLQGLPPILPDGPIRALVLGSFPSAASLESGQYGLRRTGSGALAHCRVIEDPAAPYAERVASVRRPAWRSGTCTPACSTHPLPSPTP